MAYLNRRNFCANIILAVAGRNVLGASPARAGNETPQPVDEPAADVIIDNFTFTPETLTVAIGTTVTWVNHDDIPHVVAEKALKFHSPPLDTGDVFSHRFDQAGEIYYFCTLHPRMTGTIVVK